MDGHACSQAAAGVEGTVVDLAAPADVGAWAMRVAETVVPVREPTTVTSLPTAKSVAASGAALVPYLVSGVTVTVIATPLTVTLHVSPEIAVTAPRTAGCFPLAPLADAPAPDAPGSVVGLGETGAA